MLVLEGKTVYSGTAIGPVAVLKKAAAAVACTKVEDAQAECERVCTAVKTAQAQLGELYDKAMAEAGEETAAIFEVHQMMLEDEDYLDAIYDVIRAESVNASYAVKLAGDRFAEMFAGMEDEYMKARAADIRDISSRMIRILEGEDELDVSSMEPSIILADDLTPSETVQLDKEKVLAFATVHGSANSHTAILARTMNIPALIGVPMDLEEIKNGTEAIVDGGSGRITFAPDAQQREAALEQIKRERDKKQLLETLKGKETVTKSGRKIHLYANIGNVSDVTYVLENDAEGIGLFRSEFLYLGSEDFPSEEEQFAAYRQVLEQMGDKKVIIRTLDIGADKQVDYFGLEKEENPAMGYRAIRICLTQTDIFKTQLRALLRAAVYGNLSIMYPMIISVEEVKQIYEVVAEVERELKEEGIPYRLPEQGIMIETPAAVMISDKLAELVDFFSIGTNDLTQYTLAIDRQNDKLDAFYNPHHEAILRMIKMVTDHAHACGKWVGICGELGADSALTEQFVKMGLDELSVSPSMVLPIRERIRAIESL